MEWKEYELGKLLSYEQPTAYIVDSTDYSDSYNIPVLTAGKSFILGYTNETTGIFDQLPVIIFDDFTTATQYVNFKFKVKSSAMKILHINTDLVLPKYIYYRMQIIQFDHSTHKRYWIQQYSKIKIVVPSLPEQECIVARIEELFSELDKAVENLRTTKQQLAVYRQAVLKEAFDVAMQDNPPMMPIEKLLSSERKGMSTGPFGTMIKKHEHQTTGIPMLGIENIGNGKFVDGNKIFVTPEKANELKSFILLEGDIIISRSGTVGELCAVPKRMEGALLSTNLMRVSLSNDIILSDYFIYLFQSKGIVLDQVRELCKGSTRTFLNQTILKQIKFPVPDISKQKTIVEIIESRVSVCDSIEKTVDVALQQTDALRQSILKKLLKEVLMVNHVEKWKLNELVQVVDEFDSTICDKVNESKLKFFHDYKSLLVFMAGKSVETMKEILCLVQYGYPEGALSLARNLYEQFVIAEFFHTHKVDGNFQDYIDDFFADYEIQRNKLLAFSAEYVENDIAAKQQAEQRITEIRANAHSKKKSTYWWADKDTFHNMAIDLINRQTNPDFRKFMAMYHMIYKRACVSLHASCAGNILRLGDNSEFFGVDNRPRKNGHSVPLLLGFIHFYV